MNQYQLRGAAPKTQRLRAGDCDRFDPRSMIVHQVSDEITEHATCLLTGFGYYSTFQRTARSFPPEIDGPTFLFRAMDLGPPGISSLSLGFRNFERFYLT